MENIDTIINKQNITVLSDKMQNFEESNSKIQDSLQDISDRLNLTELNNISLDQTIVKLSDSVDNLHTSSSALMSKYQEQQSNIESWQIMSQFCRRNALRLSLILHPSLLQVYLTEIFQIPHLLCLNPLLGFTLMLSYLFKGKFFSHRQNFV